MKPYVTLARALTPGGSELTLHSQDGEFFLRVNRQALMGTRASGSEMEMAQLGCARLTEKRGARVLIGGLGFGYTLRRVLELTATDAVVEVAELLPEVVQWNREFLHEVNGQLLDDPRVCVSIGDVVALIARAPAAHYDAILLDVDNGPGAMVQTGNGRLYESPGLSAVFRALKPGGRAAYWSAVPDKAFARRLAGAGFTVECVAARAWAKARRSAHTIFTADRAGS